MHRTSLALALFFTACGGNSSAPNPADANETGSDSSRDSALADSALPEDSKAVNLDVTANSTRRDSALSGDSKAADSDTSADSFVDSKSGGDVTIDRADSRADARETRGEVGDWCATAGNCGTFTDSRDNKTYGWTLIDGRKWMSEDLNHALPSGTATVNTTSVPVYHFDAALTACPAGWHLPIYEEVEDLLNYVGGSTDAGLGLKAKSGWVPWGSETPFEGEDAYAFHAVAMNEWSLGKFSFVPQEVGSWWVNHVEGYVGGETSAMTLRMTALDNQARIQTTQAGTSVAANAWVDGMNRIRCVQDPISVVRKPSSWCSTAGNCGSFVDARDGQTYNWTKIAGKTWMAQNLNYSGDDGAGHKAFTVGWCPGNNWVADTTKHADSLPCTTAAYTTLRMPPKYAPRAGTCPSRRTPLP